jgi:predicted permease
LQERDGIEGQPKVALVNEALARALWPGEEAIGRRVSVHAPPDHPDWREVVGVVADMRHGPLETGARIALYEPHRQVGDGSMSIVIRTAGDPRALAMPARAVVRSLDPTVPVTELRTMKDHVTRSLGARRFALSIVTVLSAVAIVLAAAGLYGVVSYGVAQRTNEIGVRMALGARSSDVIRLVLGEALALAGIGIAFGVAGAAAAGRFIAAMLYGVRPGDPLTLVATVALLIGVAVAASWVPARRASRVEPVNALRAE